MSETEQIDPHAPQYEGQAREQEDAAILGDADDDDSVPLEYGIVFYGADFPVDGIIRRLEDKSIAIPVLGEEYDTGSGESISGFQREFVWKKDQSDKFIESLLMGLPVPGIFLAKMPDEHHMVLDGHQRLVSLYRFYKKGVRLGKRVQEKFQNQSLKDLDIPDRRRLDDSIIHATIIKQEKPEGYGSIYHIFERLNSGGKLLTPQQIRMAMFHGRFAELLYKLNQNEDWQKLLRRRRRDPSLRDVEAVLRFFALYHDAKEYKNPMKSFLNNFMGSQKDISEEGAQQYERLFLRTVEFILSNLGEGAFCDIGGRSPKAAIVDSLMVGVAKRLETDSPPNAEKSKDCLRSLLGNSDFKDAVDNRTSQEEQVKTRLGLSQKSFGAI